MALRQHLELLPRSDLANLQGMDRRRKDSFFTGLVIVEGLLEGLNCEVLWTAEGGVREGLVADFNRQHAT